jgi:nicotinamide phosphoribosyltransferase
MKLNPLTLTDGYKLDHRRQYPEGTTLVYSNFTCRSNKLANIPDFDDKVVFFGLQGLCKWLFIDLWGSGFFNAPKDQAIDSYYRRVKNYLGQNAADAIGTEHIAALHDLGYLPILIKALPEGSLVDVKIPVLTIVNTLPEFYWITNFLEDQISNGLWKSIRVATVAYQYYKKMLKYAVITGTPKEFVAVQGHDFSLRGLGSPFDAGAQAGHLLPFIGTDTIPSIDYLETYYNANSDTELVGISVPATEHSVASMGILNINEDSTEYQEALKLFS